MDADVWAGRWAVDGEGGGGWRPTFDNRGQKCINKLRKKVCVQDLQRTLL